MSDEKKTKKTPKEPRKVGKMTGAQLYSALSEIEEQRSKLASGEVETSPSVYHDLKTRAHDIRAELAQRELFVP